jgi:hypothetical protein
VRPRVGSQVRPGREKSCAAAPYYTRPAHRLGELEVGAVQCLDRLVHHRLEPQADLLDALDGRAVHVEPAHRLHRRAARQHPPGLDPLLGEDPPVLGPAPGVGLLQPAARAEVGAGPAAGGQGVAVRAHRVRRPLGLRQVDVAEEVAHLRHRVVGSARGGVELTAP